MNDTPDILYDHEPPDTRNGWRNDVSEELILAGMDDMSERWLSCSAKFVTKITPGPDAKLPASAEKVSVCTGNHLHAVEVYSQSCDLRICPDCARRHAARLAARFVPKFLELMHEHHSTYRFRHITFTTPYSLEDVDIRKKYLTGFKQVENVMVAMMSDCPDWKSKQGFLVTAEFGEQGMKLHYHVPHYGQYLDQAKLSRLWSAETAGDACVVDVRQLQHKNKTLEESIHEVLKYVTKFYSKNKITGEIKYIPAALIPVLAKVLDKTRRVRAYGVFYKLPEPDRSDHLCDQCQSPMLSIPVSYFVTYCNTGLLPREFDRAGTDALLHLRLADNSSGLTSGLAPPYNEKTALKLQQLDFLKNIRRMSDD